MREEMAALFTRQPEEIIDGVWDYHAARDGDWYGDEDERSWLEGGRLKRNWSEAPAAWPGVEEIAPALAGGPRRMLDLCCGPGMGFVPRVLARYPQTRYLAMDASPRLVYALRRALDGPLRRYELSLACFSAFDMPLKDKSFDVVTSILGIGSTRSGTSGQRRALGEVRRVLRDDGWFVTLENSFDREAALRVFERWGQPPWALDEIPFETLCAECGFVQAVPPMVRARYLTREDNELGEQAAKFGIRIRTASTLYMLRKA